MPQYLNSSQVPLSLAVFLANDNYDYDEDAISATTLLKPIRQIVLSSRIPEEDQSVDLIQLLPSRIGTAIHDAIERSWTDNAHKALSNLGYPKKVIERIMINPSQEEELPDWVIPIYLEQRAYRQVGNHRISGKFDFVGEGFLEDFKTTSVYTYIHGTKDDDYIWQGSIYRWLNPKIITQDKMAIQFIFTDWSKAKAMADPKYPSQRTLRKTYDLKSIQETDRFVQSKLNQIDQYWNVPEPQLPQCSDTDLWRSDPVFKYYKNPDKLSRATKNFDSRQEAYIRLAEDGGKGIVIERPGEVTACKYCPGFSLCSQKDLLIERGELNLHP